VDKASNSSNGTGNMGLRFIECHEIGDSGVKIKCPSLEEFHTGAEKIVAFPEQPEALTDIYAVRWAHHRGERYLALPPHE